MARHRSRKKPMSNINVVPYIDVMLVMLVIFMITAPMLTEGVRVDLPQVEKAEPVETNNKEPLIITVDRDGRYFTGRDLEAISDEDLLIKTAAIIRHDPNIQVLVKGDGAANYGAVANLIALLRNAGAPKVGLITDRLNAASASKSKK